MKSKLVRTGMAAVMFCLLAPATASFASITNEGNETVQLQIKKKGGSKTIAKLYPDQSISIPKKAETVKALPGAGKRGDEIIKIRLVVPGKKAQILEEYDKVYYFEPKEEDADAGKKAVMPRATNRSNIPLDVEITLKNGRTNTKRVMPEETVTIPMKAVAVRVEPAGQSRGDEIINLRVRRPSGKVLSLTGYGQTMAMVDPDA